MCDIIKGRAFKDIDTSGIEHMYFVLSEPGEDDFVLIVNITDINNFPARNDLSCILNIGEHPKITKKSVVFYKKAIERKAATILSGLSSKDLIEIEKLSSQTLSKIQDGAKKSPFLLEKLKRHFNNF